MRFFKEEPMERTRIRTLLSSDNTGRTVTVSGWVRTKRESRSFAFIALNDGSTQENLQLIRPRWKFRV